MSISLALSISILFISLTQLVNAAQFLIIFFLLFGFAAAAAAAAAVFGTVIVTLIYMHHYNRINLTLTLKF